MNDLLLHETTRKNVDNFVRHPKQALLLAGPRHSGKGYLAKYIANKILGKNGRFNLQKYDAGDSGIEEVRQIIRSLSLKTSDVSENRVIIIEDLDQFSHEAQNALLKILEEPPISSYFVLTSSKIGEILPTVLSRLNRIDVLPINQNDALNRYKMSHKDEEIIRAHHISGGSAALLVSLLDSKDHKSVEAIDWAKSILAKGRYERMLEVDRLSKDKEVDLNGYMTALYKVMRASILHGKKLSDNEARIRTRQLQEINDAKESLQINVSPKLVLSNLFLNI